MARFRIATIVAGAVAALVFAASTDVSAQSVVGLSSFGVLGSTQVTNTGNSVINGNVGVSAGRSITGLLPAGPGILPERFIRTIRSRSMLERNLRRPT